MKHKLQLLICCLFLVVFNSKVRADHIAGGDITYQCVGTKPGVYIIELKMYYDCQKGGLCGCFTNIPCYKTVQIVAADGNCAGQKFRLDLYPVPNLGAYDVIQLCAMSKTICSNCGTRTPGSFSPGIEVAMVRGTINLATLTTDPTCCKFIIEADDCCRIEANTTMLNPISLSFYTNAILNKCATPCNSAPAFTNDPVVITCLGQEFTYNLGAIDPDGDSLSYAFGQSLQRSGNGGGQSVTYIPPYNADVPFPVRGVSLSSINTQCDPLMPVQGFCLDPVSGDIRFFPTSNFVANLVIEVKQWKYVSGLPTLVGVTRRDIQFYSITCANNNPPIIKTYNPNTCLPITDNKYYTCANKELCLIIAASDDNRLWDTTDLKWNNPVNMTSSGATFKPLYNVALRNLQGPMNDSFLFCWTPSADNAASLPHYFVVTAKDRMCPLPARTTKSFEVTVLNTSVSLNNKDTLKICDTSFVLNPGPYKSYQWNTGDTTGTLVVKKTGMYVVRVVNEIGCLASDSLYILITSRIATDSSFKPFQDTAIVCEDSLELNASFGFSNYLWNTGDTTQKIICKNSGMYIIQVTNKDGCKASDSVFVLINPIDNHIQLTNVFTPNDDNFNDTFKPMGSISKPYSMEIYNRWGELIFETNNIEKPWDGTYKNEEVPEGVYFYSIKAFNTCENKPNDFRGSVMLIR